MTEGIILIKIRKINASLVFINYHVFMTFIYKYTLLCFAVHVISSNKKNYLSK